jgi:hypothetical protein
LWIFLVLAALARADENADRDAIRNILGTYNDQLAGNARHAGRAQSVRLFHFISANDAITDAFIAG